MKKRTRKTSGAESILDQIEVFVREENGRGEMPTIAELAAKYDRSQSWLVAQLENDDRFIVNVAYRTHSGVASLRQSEWMIEVT